MAAPPTGAAKHFSPWEANAECSKLHKMPTTSPPRVGLSLGLGVLPDFLLGFVTSVNCGDDFELFKTQRLKVGVREHGLNIRMQITLSTLDALKLSDKTKTMVSNKPQT